MRSLAVSAAWYVDVLGFEQVGSHDAPDGSRRKVFLRHRGLRARLGLVEHRGGDGCPFAEDRVGLDHLAFAVADRDGLDRWAQHLAERDVVHTPATPANSIPGAAVLVLRDPDGIQLELFFDPTA